MCYLYENKTTNKTLEETLKFTTSGLEIVGLPPGGDTVKVKVGPGESQFVELKANAAQWKISTAVSYGIY